MLAKCLCGAIEFEFDAGAGIAMNCHCSRCRKSHGAAFATQIFSNRKSLRFIKGETDVKTYEVNGGIRAFCSVCGSRLMNYAQQHNYLSVALAAVEGEHAIAPQAHAFVGSKAAWHEPCAGIQQFEGMPNNISQYL